METCFDIHHTSKGSDLSSDPEQEEYFELNENFTHLTKLIRRQYFAYLKRIIQQNYTEWKETHPERTSQVISEEHVEKCAAHFEERAVRYCMVVQLYRKYMLRIITEIRRETTNQKLISKLKNYPFKVEAKMEVEEEIISNIKNEQLEQTNQFPKVGYKRKLQNENETTAAAHPIQVVINGHMLSNSKNNKLDKELQSQVEKPAAISRKEGHYKVYEKDKKIISFAGSVARSPNNLILVPYDSGDEGGLQSKVDASQASPDTRISRESSPERVEPPYESLSLQEKIQIFEETMMPREKEPAEISQKTIIPRKRPFLKQSVHFTHKKLSITQHVSPVSTSSEEEFNEPNTEDTVAKDLENLFAEDEKKNDIEDIFGDGSYNPEIEQILRAIENSIVPGECVAKASSVTKSKTTQDAPAGSGKKRKRYKLTPVSCDLRQSLWPCELHMQKQRLRDILGQLAEVDIRQHEIVRFRFEQLFGEDSEDEFAPYSPSLELNEILMSSCMKRIAPVIVKYLMHPLKEGLIANRYIFKKLAKKLAHNIVLIDQYADEEFIKERIDEFFCAGHRIENLMDIERI